MILIMRPSLKPHYASCQSVRPSVRPSLYVYASVLAQNKKRSKIKIGFNVYKDKSNWSARFPFILSTFFARQTGNINT